MRNMSAPLLAFLNSTRQLVTVDLFTFELKNGLTLRYCAHSSQITFAGTTWLPAPAGLMRSRINWITGVEVDTMDIVFQADASIVVNGTPMLAAGVLGLFDNCRVTFQRLFGSDFDSYVDLLDLFRGNSAPAVVLRSALHLSVKSDLDCLNVQIPPNVYQASCMRNLYDAGCAVNPATYRVSGTIGSVNADGSLGTGAGGAAGYYQMGALRFTSGPNTGLARTVKTFLAGGTVYLTSPFPFPVSAGDVFSITPGCDKLRNGDCQNKFNNVVRFKGTPFVPVPETAA